MTETERYIHIRNWDRYQHYKKRERVAWIKDYVAQLHDSDYRSLNLRQVGLLQRLRLEYAANGQRGFIESTPNLCRIVGERVYVKDLEALNHAGFILFSSSKLIDKVYTDASPEEETEREEQEQEQNQHHSIQPPTSNGSTHTQTTDRWNELIKDL